MDALKQIILWVAIGAALAPVWATFLWELWEGAVRPHLIPRGEVERLAAAMLARYGESAEEIAFIEEDRAWRYCDSFEQGKWRRVRRRIGRGPE